MIRQKNIHIVLAITLLLGLVVDIVEAGSKKRRGTAGAQELLIPTGSRGTAMAGAYDIPVVPHGSGAYSYHFVITQPHCPFCEYLNTSEDCLSFPPVFGNMFKNEILPQNGKIKLTDDPGWGMKLNRNGLKLNRVFKSTE